MSSIKALLLGLNYRGTENELMGCINDVSLMNNCLLNYLGVNSENIDICTDNTDIKPTKSNIIGLIENSIEEVNNNPNLRTLWIHYSGHGSYINDMNDDEDYINNNGILYYGYDEVLCTLDEDYIKDDDLNILFSKLNKNKELVCIFDCCHSGTALDLPYKYDYVNDRCIVEKNKNLIKCNAILLSGAKDDQTAADANGLSKKYNYSGAFTTGILKACEETESVYLDKIIDYVGNYLKENGFSQVPQVTSTMKINKNVEFMSSIHRKRIIRRINEYKRLILLCEKYYKRYRIYKYIYYKNYFINKLQELKIRLI